jgi:hypothetical protein
MDAKDIGEIKESDSLGMKISKLLFAEYPEMTKGEPVSVTKAACTMADILGCVVALLKPSFSPEDFERLMAGLKMRIDVSRDDIVETGTALRESRDAKKH